MPRLPEYTNPIDTLTLTDRATTAFEQEGHQARVFGNEAAAAQLAGSQALGNGFKALGGAIGDIWQNAEDAKAQAKAEADKAAKEQKAQMKTAEEAQAQREISGSYLDLAMRDLKHTQIANQMFQNVDPNDYAGKAHEFVNGLQDEHDQFMQQFSTDKSRNFGERQWAQHVAHVVNRTVADGATATGDMVQSQFHRAVNAQAQAAYDDPTSIATKLSNLDDAVTSIITSTPMAPSRAAQLRSNLIDQGREAIIIRGAQGAIDKDPSSAATIVKEYGEKGWLTGAQQKQLTDYGERMGKAQLQDARSAALGGVQRTQERSLAASSQYLGNLTDGQGKFQAKGDWATKVIADPSLRNEEKAPLLQANQRLLDHGDVEKTSPDVLTPFISDIAKGNRPAVADVMRHVGVDMTLADAQFLTMGINPQSDTARQDFSAINVALGNARQQISPRDTAGASNPAGDNAYGRFVDWYMPAIRQGLAAGKSITQLTDPDSPDYLLKNNKVQEFAPTHEDAVATSLSKQKWVASPAAGVARFDWAAHPSTVEEAQKVTWGQHPASMQGVQALGEILTEASKSLPEGYRVVVTSTTDHSKNVHGGGTSHHTEGNGMDIQIYGPDGPIRNRGADPTGLYRRLADEARKVADAQAPGVLAWGGNFTTSAHGGEKDLMHFDLGGNRGDGTWDRPARPSLPDLYAGRLRRSR